MSPFKLGTVSGGKFCHLLLTHALRSYRSRGQEKPAALAFSPLSVHSSIPPFQRPAQVHGRPHLAVSHPTRISTHDCSYSAWTWQQQSHQMKIPSLVRRRSDPAGWRAASVQLGKKTKHTYEFCYCIISVNVICKHVYIHAYDYYHWEHYLD